MTYATLSQLISGAISGQLVSFPTDTVPALAARPDRSGLIFAAKQRDTSKPLILMGATAEDLWQYVYGNDGERQLWQRVAGIYWPGPLTLVLPASDRLPPQVNPTDPTTIGVRVPNNAIARHILSQTAPLATTSANRSGEPPLPTLSKIAAEFPQALTLNPVEVTEIPGIGVPSTVAKWTGNGWEILRQGAITQEQLLAIDRSI
ncbi:MAG: L-threonylcarbamoyladenylate synthase [Geitlerinemataceae cyanobacterium]